MVSSSNGASCYIDRDRTPTCGGASINWVGAYGIGEQPNPRSRAGAPRLSLLEGVEVSCNVPELDLYDFGITDDRL